MFDVGIPFSSSYDFTSFKWPERDLVCGGADLEPGTILDAYRQGLFPMPIEGELMWWSPIERGILRPGDLKVSKSLRRSLRDFSFTVDTEFENVIDRCADPRRPGGWISDPIKDAYVKLHEAGWAHSIETRDADGLLVGGLYGIAMGSFFAGESMFHAKRDASKAALVHLVGIMSDTEKWLIDTQWSTPHLASLGVTTVSRSTYLTLLSEIIGVSSGFSP
ncbi:MAG: leucyl/phenylalanyl-tRNA--protein transferase [Aeromicrobium sp.]|nr:MAG: leucyl/phenylalanyl-tRNA--protein transferase [Aeromicrobium sp.]